jgi:replicative DNA helicase
MENTDLKERIPPQAVEIEMAVLGTMMKYQEAVFQVMAVLKPEHFYKTSNQKIYSTISVLFNKSEAIDAKLVGEQLRKNGDLEAIGGAYYLTECMNQEMSLANIEYHARIILEKSMLRDMIVISQNIMDASYDAREDAQTLLDQAEQKIMSIGEAGMKSGFEEISPILHDAMEVMEKYNHRQGEVIGVATGFTKLDELTAGFQNSDLIIIAGRPSMGKTAFSLNMARNAAIDNKIGVGFFSLEMSKFQLASRLLSSDARINSNNLRRGRLSNQEWSKLSLAAGALSDAPLFIDDTASLSVFELRAKARRLKSKHNIGLLIVDYLQLMRGPAGKESRQQEISEISRSLKAVAKELDIPVVALSQLSRQPEMRGGENKRPILSDLRESGALEQDADVVVFIYREEAYISDKNDLDSSIENVAEIIIGKQRNGPTGTVKLTFLKDIVRFENMAHEEEFAT